MAENDLLIISLIIDISIWLSPIFYGRRKEEGSDLIVITWVLINI